jgi:hypothetical protein
MYLMKCTNLKKMKKNELELEEMKNESDYESNLQMNQKMHNKQKIAASVKRKQSSFPI